MRSVAAAVLVLALAMAGTAGAVETIGSGVLCAASAPTDLDSRIAAAVGATSVSVPTTPPIAILDTGVVPDAAEFAGRIVSPFDAASGSSDASDVDGHGTEVAGIAAGAPGLVLGVSPTSPIMPIRIYNRSGDTTPQWMAAGINWAVANGAGVINISPSIPQSDATSADIASLTHAITDAFDKGVLVVASVGTDGNSQQNLPASLPHVLAVGASDLTGSRATFSNFGPWVDLVAPATSMVAPTTKVFCPSGYGVANGTSFAAPAVAGAAAILEQLRPTLTPQQKFDILRASASDQAPTGRDDDTGYGLLNLPAALNAPAPASASREVDDDPYYVRGPFVALHPVLLANARKAKLVDSVSPAKDPSDVYPVRIKKGERFFANATVSGADSLIALGLWKPTVGDFDVTNEVGKNEIVSTGGFSSSVALKMIAKRTGTYYLSVEAPDPVDPEDPTSFAPALEPYQLTITKAPPLKPSKKRSRSKKKER